MCGYAHIKDDIISQIYQTFYFYKALNFVKNISDKSLKILCNNCL